MENIVTMIATTGIVFGILFGLVLTQLSTVAIAASKQKRDVSTAVQDVVKMDKVLIAGTYSVMRCIFRRTREDAVLADKGRDDTKQ